jgi:hypothetical protein
VRSSAGTTSTLAAAELSAKGIEFTSEPKDEGFGIVTHMLLPGGVEMQLYEPRHAVAYDL